LAVLLFPFVPTMNQLCRSKSRKSFGVPTNVELEPDASVVAEAGLPPPEL
jgi:hypothetical protein